MKCPLSMNTVGIYGEKVFDKPQDCLKEECAWWNWVEQECNLVTIAVELFNIRCQKEEKE